MKLFQWNGRLLVNIGVVLNLIEYCYKIFQDKQQKLLGICNQRQNLQPTSRKFK